ncbi:MAG: hypothetical protein AAF488_01190, partial [Planctomycetota bacterium]
LDGSTGATWSGDDGVRSVILARGTLGAEPSVWRGADLSDLVVGGALSSPRRGETLRYQPTLDGVEASLPLVSGWGSFLIKPARAASASPDPNRERVVLRRTSEGTLRFAPSVAWILEHHPSPPPTIASLTIGGGERSVKVIDEVVRRPSVAQWSYRRSLVIHGPPWTVQAWGPSGAGSVWSIDSVVPWFPDREVSVSDTSSAGHWSRVAFGWSPEELEFAFDTSLSSAAHGWNANAFTFTAGAFVVEAGGSIGEGHAGSLPPKSFDGVLRDLGFDAGTLPPFDEKSVKPRRETVESGRLRSAHGRRIVTPPSGAQWASARVHGVFPSELAVEWRVQPLGVSPSHAITGFGRHFRSVFPPAPRYQVELWLHEDPDSGEVPLLDAVEVEWRWPVLRPE